MNGVLYFAVGTVGLSKRNGRKPSTLMQAIRHNRREIQAELGAHSHIDATSTQHNETIAGAGNAAAVVALAQSLLVGAGVDTAKLRKDYCQAIELLFSLAPDTTLNTGDYFRRCLACAVAHFGADNVLAADIHRDESAPHCHILIAPMQDGGHVGSALIDRAALAKLRESFAKKVGEPFGLKAPPRRLSGAARVLATRLVLHRLESGREAFLTQALEIIKHDIACDPAKYLQALGIELSAESPACKSKTMAQIFTSKGKGAKTERASKRDFQELAKPIGFAIKSEIPAWAQGLYSQHKPIGLQNDRLQQRNLCSVGFADLKHMQSSLAEAQTMAVAETVRVRESEQAVAFFDTETGEYFAPPLSLPKNNKVSANAWVAGKLLQLHAH